MKYKKGVLSAEVVVILFLAVIIAIGVFIILKPFANLGESTGNKDAIKAWVLTKSNSKTFTGNERPPIPSLSEPLEINSVSKLKSKGGNPPETFVDIADSMYDCWDAFGRGNMNFVGLVARKVFCYPCRVIKFSPTVYTESPNLPPGFLRFLNTEKISSISDETYLQYLRNSPELVLEESEVIKESLLTTSSNYYITFVGISDVRLEDSFNATVSILNSEQFINTCNDYENEGEADRDIVPGMEPGMSASI